MTDKQHIPTTEQVRDGFRYDELAEGLCGNREDHEPHYMEFVPVANGPMRCHADQTQRVPFAIRQPQFERGNA